MNVKRFDKLVFHKRMLHLIARCGSNARAAEIAGVSPPAIKRWIEGAVPSFDLVVNLCSYFSLPVDWLLSSDEIADAPVPYHSRGDATTYLSINVADGERRGVDYLRFRADYLRARLNINVSDLLLVPVDDDGAAPTLLRGGVCICHVAASAGDGLWALHAANGAFAFRRVFAGSRSVQVFRADASGEAQPIESMPLDDFHRAAVGRVVWGGERFFD